MQRFVRFYGVRGQALETLDIECMNERQRNACVLQYFDSLHAIGWLDSDTHADLPERLNQCA